MLRGHGGALLETSEPFSLPADRGETVERMVTVRPPTATPPAVATAQAAELPAAGVPAAQATATPTAATAMVMPTPTAIRPAAGEPWPTVEGPKPVAQPEASAERSPAPCVSPLVGAGLMGLLLLGIAGGLFWQRRRWR